ncbi:MAG: 30S ribosomal protein S18 [Ignavibacteria bacterium]|jgi:small subunit ribosomal protein S18|nr:30S ribosomal protein S18 [Ignavibacteria bacterium]
MYQQFNNPNPSFRPMGGGPNAGGGRSLYPMQMGNTQQYGGHNNNSRFGGRNNNNQQQQQPRRVEKKRPNPFEDKKLKTIDYLDGKALLRFTNDQGKILPKRINGTTAFQQRQLAKAIKYARHLALLPFVAKDLS